MPENLFRDCKLPLCRNTVSLHTGVMETDKRNTSRKEWGSTGWCTFPEILVTALPVTKKKKEGGKGWRGKCLSHFLPKPENAVSKLLTLQAEKLKVPFSFVRNGTNNLPWERTSTWFMVFRTSCSNLPFRSDHSRLIYWPFHTERNWEAPQGLC